MITDADIKKLRKVFATKDDLKSLATKEDIKSLATKKDFRELNAKIDTIYTNLAESIGNILFEVKEVKDELKNHSKKIKKLENVRIN